jgi:VWFA-related protein
MRPAVLLLAACLTCSAQDVIRITSKEVLVDVVVRDKKGKFLHKLSATDFTLFDDGKPQNIASFREVTEGEPAESPNTPKQPATSGPVKQADMSRPVRLVSLVFDRLAVDSRRIARQGALDMLKNEIAPNTYYGVFSIDQRLRIFQTFTNDRAKLRAAVERVTSITGSDFANDNAGLKQASSETSGSEGAAAAASATAIANGGKVDGGGMANEAMDHMVQDMLSFSTELSREQEGRASIFSLFAVIREQMRLPGRKALVYFAEGIQLPNSLWSPFQALISAANQANVSVYSVDARGVRVESDQIGASAMMRSASVNSYKQATTLDTVPVRRTDAMMFDQAQDSIRANVQQTLGELAEGTGGALIANTNDVRIGLKRVTEELDAHYEISYQSSNETNGWTLPCHRGEVKQARWSGTGPQRIFCAAGARWPGRLSI